MNVIIYQDRGVGTWPADCRPTFQYAGNRWQCQAMRRSNDQAWASACPISVRVMRTRRRRPPTPLKGPTNHQRRLDCGDNPETPRLGSSKLIGASSSDRATR